MAEARNETALVHRIVKAIKALYPDAWIFKVHGSAFQTAGTPDLLVCIGGRLVALEVKHQKPGESEEHARDRTTLLQHTRIAELQRAGAVATVVISVEEALAAVKALSAA